MIKGSCFLFLENLELPWLDLYPQNVQTNYDEAFYYWNYY